MYPTKWQDVIEKDVITSYIGMCGVSIILDWCGWYVKQRTQLFLTNDNYSTINITTFNKLQY